MSRWVRWVMVFVVGVAPMLACQQTEDPKKKRVSAARLPCYKRRISNCSTYSMYYTCTWNGASCVTNYGSNYGSTWSGQNQYPYNSNGTNYGTNYGTSGYSNCSQYTSQPTMCVGSCVMQGSQCMDRYGSVNQWNTGAWNTGYNNQGTGWYNQYPMYQQNQNNLGGMMGLAGGLGAAAGILSGGGVNGALQGAVQGVQQQLNAQGGYMGGGYPNGYIGTGYYPQTGMYPYGTYYPYQSTPNQYNPYYPMP